MLVALCAFVVEWSVFAHGLPLLRHDWRFPPRSADLGDLLVSFFTGWTTAGIGASQPYPTFYAYGLLLWPFHKLLSPFAVVLLLATTSLVFLWIGSVRLVDERRGTLLHSAALFCFAAMNPWVYSELVAGHLMMVLAYSCLLVLIAELTAGTPRERWIVGMSALAITQIEFYVVVIVPLAYYFAASRRLRALAAIVVSGIPIVVGLAGSLGTLSAIPYILEWQRAESVSFVPALVLRGYQFAYDASFSSVAPSLILCAIVAASAIPSSWKSSSIERAIAVVAGAVLLWSSGVRGPLAAIYTFAVTHAKATAVFRELYDLIALLALAYIVLSARALSRSRLAATIFSICAVALAVPWLQHPAFDWFVSPDALPAAEVTAHADERAAYFPAFQPLNRSGRGAGVDPDAFPGEAIATPVNEAFPTYPVDVALANAYSNDFADLKALGVGHIVARPYLSSDWISLRDQLAVSPEAPAFEPESRVIANAMPLFSVYESKPDETSLGDGLDENSVSPALQTATILHGSTVTIDPSKDWVDARLSFIAIPRWANPWGGALTTGTGALDVPAGSGAILAGVTGTLVDERANVISSGTPTLRWLSLKSSDRLRCVGRCIVVAAAQSVPSRPLHGPLRRYRAVSGRTLAPWLSVVSLPPHTGRTLRFNVRFDDHWLAFDGHRVFDHLPLDGIFNAWIVPVAESPRYLVVMNWFVALQLLLEIISVLLVVALLAWPWRPRRTQTLR